MNSDVLRRLALVRQLHGTAVETSHRPSPQNGLAVLPLHDAVEMFMQLAVEFTQADISKKADFDQYWTALEAKGHKLGSRESMRRLNSARVALKHSGLLPDRAEISGFVASVTNFLADSSKAIFVLDINSASRGFLIQDARVRGLIEEAENSFNAGDLKKTMENTKIAFDMALLYKQNSDLYDPRARLRDSNFFNLGMDQNRSGAAKAIRSVSEIFGEAIMVIGYQLDFAGYRLLKTHSPVVHHIFGGDPLVEWMRDPMTNPEVVGRCLDFVIDTCLRLQQREGQ